MVVSVQLVTQALLCSLGSWAGAVLSAAGCGQGKFPSVLEAISFSVAPTTEY